MDVVVIGVVVDVVGIGVIVVDVVGIGVVVVDVVDAVVMFPLCRVSSLQELLFYLS